MRNSILLAMAALILPLMGCRNDMHDQPRYKPLAATDFFSDHRSARQPVEGTIARGYARIDEARYTGKINGEDIDQFPFPITKADIERGQNRFNVYCTPCHGRLGDGTGLVVQRGFRQPPSYYEQRIMNAPVGHFFDVMTNGFGAMASYASRVEPDDRWRIAAYIRALQLSENAKISDVPADQQQNLPAETPPRGLNQGPLPQAPAAPAGQPAPNAVPEPGGKQ